MEDAAQSEDGLFPIYYAWDKEKEQLREQSGEQGTNGIATVSRCTVCGDKQHSAAKCFHEYWTCRIRYCKYCSALLPGKEVNGVCCGKTNNSKCRVSFQRTHYYPELLKYTHCVYSATILYD